MTGDLRVDRDAGKVTLNFGTLIGQAFTIDDPVPGREYPFRVSVTVNGEKSEDFEFTAVGV